jgi:protein TonB
MSPARARLFADAAVKKYQEHRSRAAASRLRRAALVRRPLAAGVGALALVACIAVFALRDRASGPRIAPTPKPVLVTASDAARAVAPATVPAAAQANVPAGTPASSGEVRERLLAQAETALLAERLDDAATAIEVARNAGVEAGRIAFLNAQLAKSRERRVVSPSAAAPGKGESPVTPLVIGTGQAGSGLIAAQRHDALSVTGPAQATGPASAIGSAQASGSAPASVSAQATSPAQASGSAQATSPAHAIGSAPAGGPIAPPASGATPAGPAPPGPAIAALGSTDAKSPLTGGTDPASAQRQSSGTRSDIVDANSLTLLKSVPPAYPAKAAMSGTEGWVELDFSVLANGTVKAIGVRAANPTGVFEEAAKNALARWRYAPVLRDGQPTEQRARIRLRFTLQN